MNVQHTSKQEVTLKKNPLFHRVLLFVTITLRLYDIHIHIAFFFFQSVQTNQ